jgi:hypothetical protein
MSLPDSIRQSSASDNLASASDNLNRRAEPDDDGPMQY